MANALEELQEFEKHADIAIAKLSLWRLPTRSILSVIYLSVAGQYVGMRFNREGPRNDAVGTAMLTRMSYVVQHFVKCSRQIGADVNGALSVVDREFQSDFEQMLGYAHFCEIMPLVRRGYLSVERKPSTFILSHPNHEFAIEPLRVCRRLQILRDWSHGESQDVP